MEGVAQSRSAIGHDGEHRDPAAEIAQLTPTQLKVLRGVHSGLLNKQIAHDLGIAEATVKAHMTALMRKLKVHNRTQAAMAVQAIGRTLNIDSGNDPSLAH